MNETIILSFVLLVICEFLCATQRSCARGIKHQIKGFKEGSKQNRDFFMDINETINKHRRPGVPPLKLEDMKPPKAWMIERIVLIFVYCIGYLACLTFLIIYGIKTVWWYSFILAILMLAAILIQNNFLLDMVTRIKWGGNSVVSRIGLIIIPIILFAMFKILF